MWKGDGHCRWNQAPKLIQKLAIHEAPSEVNTTLEGTTCSRLKLDYFSKSNFFLMNKNATCKFQDQCCHLRDLSSNLQTTIKCVVIFSKKCRIQTFNGKAGVCKKIQLLLNLSLYHALNTSMYKLRNIWLSADIVQLAFYKPTSCKSLACKHRQFLSLMEQLYWECVVYSFISNRLPR